MSRERITLSRTKLNRIQVLEQTLGGLITTRDAALVLGLSERHVCRLRAKPAHTIPGNIRQQVVQLAQTKYWGCNYAFLSELLHEYEGISLSPSSVARILKAAGISSPKSTGLLNFTAAVNVNLKQPSSPNRRQPPRLAGRPHRMLLPDPPGKAGAYLLLEGTPLIELRLYHPLRLQEL